MSGRKLHWLGFGLVATAGAGLLTLTAMMNTAFAYGAPVADPPPPPVAPVAPPFPNDDVSVAELMSGSGTPIPQLGGTPPGSFMNDVFIRYLQPNFPHLPFPASGVCDVTTCDGVTGLVTPEGLYPFDGVKELTFDNSVAQGVTILEQAINGQLAANSEEPIGVFGLSQSADIASLAMTDLAHQTHPVSPEDLNFVLTGDQMNPNGGILERFDGLTLPALGFTFYGATPDNLYPTEIYTLEYDGYADFPQYPLNLLSDLNAFLGIEFVHGMYPTLTADQLDHAVPLTDVVEPTMTNYFMIPVQNLPLLDILRDLPVIGNPVADLLQPDLTLLVNLGYENSNPLEGWSNVDVNQPTPFGLFPSLSQIIAALQLLGPQTELGIQNFIGDFTGSGPNPVSLAALPDFASSPASGLSSLLSDPAAVLAALASPADTLGVINNIVNAFTSATASAYATLLPTADIANSLLTSFPLYDANLFVNGIEQLIGGNPIGLLNAFGDPVAADTALLTLAGGFEAVVILNAAESIVGDFTSLIP